MGKGGIQPENQASLVERDHPLYRALSSLLGRVSLRNLGSLHVGKSMRTIVCGSGTQERGLSQRP